MLANLINKINWNINNNLLLKWLENSNSMIIHKSNQLLELNLITNALYRIT